MLPIEGEKLENGAVALMVKELPAEYGQLRASIVLAYNQDSHEFVTWMHVQAEPQSYCTHGWYTTDVVQAIEDYQFRVKRLTAGWADPPRPR